MPRPPNLDDLSFLKEIPDLPGTSAASEPQRVSQTNAAPPPPTPFPLPVASTPNRALVRRRWKHALLLAAAWMGAHLAVYGVREDLGQLPLPYLLVQIAAPLAIGVLSLVLALSPGRFGLGAALGITASLALVGPLSFACAALGMPAPLPVRAGTWVDHFVCLDLTLVWMSVPLLLFSFHLRGAFAAGASVRSALIGAACGLFAAAMMNLHCSNVEQFHMLLGHAVPVGIGCLLGGLVAARWLRA